MGMKNYIYILAIMFCSVAYTQEIHTWTTSEGQIDAAFWYVGKGIIGLRKDGQTKELKLSSISPQDLNYVLSKKHVMDKSYTLSIFWVF